MSTQKGILARKRVFVLGAGASRGLHAKAPLNSELLPNLLRLAQTNGQQQDNILVDRLHRFRDFIDDFYPGPEDDNTSPPLIEDVLTLLDSSIRDKHQLSQCYSIPKLKILRDDLIYGICKTLQQELDHSGVSTNRQAARRFVDEVHLNASVISLNYDLIIDNILLDQGDTPDYGVETRDQHIQTYGKRIYVYKPHGSLNWLYCSHCKQLDITDYVKSAQYIFGPQNRRSSCFVCGKPYKPVLITPTYLKDYNRPILKDIWKQAEEVLVEADEIVFVGYSLPDADVVLRSIFSRAVFANRKKSPGSCEIVVVSRGENGEMNALKQRYTRLFGTVDLDPTGFVEYIRRGCKTPSQWAKREAESSRGSS